MADAKRSRFIEFALIFVVAYLLSQVLMNVFFPGKDESQPQTGVVLSAVDATIRGGHHPEVTIINHTSQPLTLPARCPQPPLDVFKAEGEGVGQGTQLIASETVIPCPAIESVPANGEMKFSFAPWKYSLFGEDGIYEVRLPQNVQVQGTGATIASTRFEIYAPGTIVKTFRTFVTKPLLNFLVFIAGVLPGHSLGLGIIILTILVKLLLFIPTQHAMEGQKKMQLLQPKLEALRRQYPDDAKKQQEETMKLWKEHGVNPVQSCLPMLIQFPILIGLFYVIQDGSHLELSKHLLYSFHENLSWTFNHFFLGMDLTKSNWIFPPLLVILQYIQMKMSFASAKKKAQQEGKEPDGSQAMQQKMMLYALPLMIGFFAIQFPAAVSLYWGVSTVFGIGQQAIVNREKIKP